MINDRNENGVALAVVIPHHRVHVQVRIPNYQTLEILCLHAIIKTGQHYNGTLVEIINLDDSICVPAAYVLNEGLVMGAPDIGAMPVILPDDILYDRLLGLAEENNIQ